MPTKTISPTGQLAAKISRRERFLERDRRFLRRLYAVPPPPPVLVNKGGGDEPHLKFTLYHATPQGGWCETWHFPEESTWSQYEVFDALLENVRHNLALNVVIVGARVPWLDEKVVYDPPLGRLEE